MDMELREFVKRSPARSALSTKMWLALVILAVVANPFGAAASPLDRGNLGDWRTIAFHCDTDDRPPPFVSTVCAMVKRQVEEAARRGNVPLLAPPTAAEFGFLVGSGLPSLVARVSTTNGTEAAGIAVHVSLRAQQHFAGDVRTRRSVEPGEPFRAYRSGDLVLWERGVTGFVIGPNAASHLAAPMNSMVQEFFVTLLGARR